MHKVLSDLPYAPQFDTPNACDERLLQQPFFFLGSGGTSYSFVSEDGKLVLKLFKHQHLHPRGVLLHTRLPLAMQPMQVRMLLSREHRQAHKRLPFLFQSTLLAWQRLQEETGLIHLQLNCKPHSIDPIALYDRLGCKHTLDLSRTEYLLQKRAQPAYQRIHQLMARGEIAHAMRCLDRILDLIARIRMKGIWDRDPNVEINFGFVGDEAIEFDLGSFRLARGTPPNLAPLLHWLQTHYPVLAAHLNNQLEKKGLSQ